jgi:hypothetical protein
MARRGVRIRRGFQTAAAVAGIILVVIFLPILMPIAFILHARDVKRLQALAEHSHCTNCGYRLGQEALDLADKASADYVEELHRDAPPGTRFRLVRRIHAICTQCGLQYRFDDKARTLDPAPHHDWLPLPQSLNRQTAKPAG